jgi:hypothetical protein
MTEPRKHHFVSQFYLAGFTDDGTKDGVLYCFDLLKKRVWPSNTKEVAHERDFNRVDAPGVQPSLLENELAKLETDFSTAFRAIKKERSLSTPDHFNSLMNFIALLGVRNPALRSNIDATQSQLLRVIMELYLQDREHWERFKSQALKDGLESIRHLSYEAAKKYFLEHDWEVKNDPNSFHPLEFGVLDEVVQLLAGRDWTLIVAPHPLHFITTDRPVTLTWTLPNSTVPFGPGFGSLHSAVYFALDRSMVLLGRFDSTSGTIDANANLVGGFNSMLAVQARRFVYGPADKFQMLDADDHLIDSHDFLESQPNRPQATSSIESHSNERLTNGKPALAH